MNLAAATRLAERIRDEIAPHCDRIEIAGSIRRLRPECGDIDLVCLPKIGGKAAITERCGRTAKLVKHGTQYVVFELANGFQLDLWFAHSGPAISSPASPATGARSCSPAPAALPIISISVASPTGVACTSTRTVA